MINHDYAFFTSMILKPAQPIAATRQVVHVTGDEFAAEFFVVWEATVGRQQQEASHYAFQVAILLERSPEVAKVVFSQFVGTAQMARRKTFD